jgi:hypothetical protein
MGQGPGQPSDLFSGLPFGEAELLAYVEDDSSSERGPALAAFLQTRPDVRRALDAMREDHLLLRQTGEAGAPEGIVDEALAVLEREALFEAQGRVVEPAPAPIPIERARPGRAFRALALAAGFLMLAGGASYWISILVKPAQTGPVQNQGVIALETAPSEEQKLLAKADTDVPVVHEQSPLPPIEDEPSDAREMDREPGAVALKDGGDEPAQGTPVKLNGIDSSSNYPVLTISPDRALELAREGRLAIYLTARASKARSDARGAVVESSQDLPSAALVIDIPATTAAIADLCSSLSDSADRDVSLGELPEAYQGSAGAADREIARYWDRVSVPVVVDDAEP